MSETLLKSFSDTPAQKGLELLPLILKFVFLSLNITSLDIFMEFVNEFLPTGFTVKQ